MVVTVRVMRARRIVLLLLLVVVVLFPLLGLVHRAMVKMMNTEKERKKKRNKGCGGEGAVAVVGPVFCYDSSLFLSVGKICARVLFFAMQIALCANKINSNFGQKTMLFKRLRYVDKMVGRCRRCNECQSWIFDAKQVWKRGYSEIWIILDQHLPRRALF